MTSEELIDITKEKIRKSILAAFSRPKIAELVDYWRGYIDGLKFMGGISNEDCTAMFDFIHSIEIIAVKKLLHIGD